MTDRFAVKSPETLETVTHTYTPAIYKIKNNKNKHKAIQSYVHFVKLAKRIV